jgi:hypothetical protein
VTHSIHRHDDWYVCRWCDDRWRNLPVGTCDELLPHLEAELQAGWDIVTPPPPPEGAVTRGVIQERISALIGLMTKKAA